MSFPTTLFKAVATADHVAVYGRLMFSCSESFDTSGEKIIYLNYAGDSDPGFKDQGVLVFNHGKFIAKNLDGTDIAFEVVMHRPLSIADIYR